MATLDVSPIPVSDPFASRFDVLRRPETITEFGRSATEQVVARGKYGTFYPTGDNRLVRQSDYEHGRKTLTCVTTYRLQQASPGFQPDVVLYRGNRYIVVEVRDFGEYGAGFVEAQLSSTLAQDAPSQ
jgi:hypothetical protein